jgi:hypothetical protein
MSSDIHFGAKVRPREPRGFLGLPRFCRPEKCSRTYPKFARLVGHTLQTGEMFLDLSGFLLAL